jgi:hypothetical protein
VPKLRPFFVSDLNVQISPQEIGIKKEMIKPTSITALHTFPFMANDDSTTTICSARGDIMADRTRVQVGTVDLRRIGESAL